MATVTIKISKKGLRIDQVTKAVDKLEADIKASFEGASISVTKYEPPESRADRLSEARDKAEEAGSEVESLKDELQDWFDNLPESFQNGEKGDSIQTAIDALDSLKSDIDNLDFDGVEFPGMYS